MRIRGTGGVRGRGRGRGQWRGQGQWRGRGRGRGQCLPNDSNHVLQPSQSCTDSPCPEPSQPSPGATTPKFDLDKLIAYEKKRKDEVANQPSAPTNVHSVGESSGPKSTIRTEPMSAVHVKDLIIPPPALKKFKVSHTESSFQNSPFAGIEGYKVKSPTNACLALSALNTISRAVSDYVGTIGHLSDKQDVLQKRVEELQKKNCEVEKLLNKTQEGKKKAEEDLELSRSEVIRLIARVTKVEGHMKKLEEELAKAKEDLGVAQGKVKELEGELDGTLTEALDQYKAGYAAALCHLKVKSPDFDTSGMTYATKVVEGKLVVQDSTV